MKGTLPAWTTYNDQACCRDTFEEHQGYVFVCVLPPGHQGSHRGINTEWPEGRMRLDAARLGWFDDSAGTGIWEPNVYGFRARRKGGSEDPTVKEPTP